MNTETESIAREFVAVIRERVGPTFTLDDAEAEEAAEKVLSAVREEERKRAVAIVNAAAPGSYAKLILREVASAIRSSTEGDRHDG